MELARPDATDLAEGAEAALASAHMRAPAHEEMRPTVEQVRTQVQTILQAGPLARANRTRKLLEYVVDQTLAGHSKLLKQYSIATEALGRGADFDPDTDPIVRLEASKLRRALDDYYLRSGSKDPVRISIPKGSYVPSFVLIGADNGLAVEAAFAPRLGDFAATALSAQRLLIMPFHVQIRSEANQALTDGLFEQLSVELARYSDISLVTHLLHGDAAPDPVSAGVKARTQFVVSGSVRQNREQIRVTARLHDVSASAIIWTECYDLDAGSNLDLQAEDRIARHISGAIADYHGVVSHTLSLRSVYSAGRVWSLQDAIQRHRYLARTLSERVYRIARADLEVGVTHAAHHPMIWAALAHTIFYGNVLGFDEDENWLALVYRYAHRSFELDHKCAFGHVVMGLHALYQRDCDGVFETCRRILQDNPHAPSTKLSAGFFRALAGDWDNGTKMLNSALSGLLHPPGWAYRVTFLDHYRRRNYGEALHEIGKYHAPENFTPSLLRAAALAQLGRIEEASGSVAEVLRICSRFNAIAPRYFQYLTVFDDIQDHLMEGLHRAGLKL